jgi:hypothetical protein
VVPSKWYRLVVFIGHYGVSFAAKRWAPRVSLGVLFVAVQALDVVFSVDVVTGAEKMRITPHFTAYNPYDLYWMPWSHSLLAALAWSVALALVWLIVARGVKGRGREAIVVGLAVLSHWILDLPMHTRDLQIVPWSATRVGLGLWNHRGAALATELIVFVFGVACYVRSFPAKDARGRRPMQIFVAVLFVLTVVTPYLPDPSSTFAWAAQAFFAYALLAYVAARIDRARSEGRSSA